MSAAYPLAWPAGWPRTKCRISGRFREKRGNMLREVSLGEARTRLADELDALGGSAPIISTNVELRADGHPRGGRAEPSDPGTALYFTLRGVPTVLACDRYLRVADNIAALAATIEAKRAITRHGAVTVEQEFRGYAALPAPLVPDDWRAALGHPRTLAEAEVAYRARAKAAHPDAGGSAADMAALNAAIAAARKAAW